MVVKPARLHFARTARALTGRYVCERGVLSEFPAARARACYWFDKLCGRSLPMLWSPYFARAGKIGDHNMGAGRGKRVDNKMDD